MWAGSCKAFVAMLGQPLIDPFAGVDLSLEIENYIESAAGSFIFNIYYSVKNPDMFVFSNT